MCKSAEGKIFGWIDEYSDAIIRGGVRILVI